MPGAVGSAKSGAGPRPRAPAWWRANALPWAFVAPVALLVAIGVLYPLGYIVVLGFEEYSPYLGKPRAWTGFANYARASKGWSMPSAATRRDFASS